LNGRNRLFFLSNFDGYRERKQVKAGAAVPLTAMRNGDFSSAAPIYDPATRVTGSDGVIRALQFPSNSIPLARVPQTSRKLLEFYPEPNFNLAGAGANYQVSQPRQVDKDQFTQRVDVVESASSTWMGRISWGDEIQMTPSAGGTLAPKLNGTKLNTDFLQAALSNTRGFGPSALNEFRFGYNRFYNSLGFELSNVRNVPAELAIPGLAPVLPPNAWGIPNITITGYSMFGNLGDGPFVNHNRIRQWTDTFSLTRGKHTLRFGAEVRTDDYDQIGNSVTIGRFTFDSSATQNPAARKGTGNGFGDFLLGLPKTSEGALDLAIVKFRALSQAWFIDEKWRLRPDLTLSIGLRYENTPPWMDGSGTLINAAVSFADQTPNVADLSRHPTLVRIGSGDFYEGTSLRFNPAIKVARDGRLGDRLVARDNNDFAPRLGLAWNPASRWTLRAGAGSFYSQDSGNGRFDMARNIAGRRLDGANADAPDLSWDRPFRGLGGTVQVDTPFVLANQYRYRTAYAMQFLFNAQYLLSGNTVLEAGYVGTLSRKLQILRFFNQPVPEATGSIAARTPYPELGRIQVADPVGKAAYHALALKAQRRFSRGLTYLAGYTWSRSMDTLSALRGHGDDIFFPQDSTCIQCDRARSNFNVAHRFVTSVLYALPVGANRWWGGWEVGSIATLQTGFPFTVVAGTDRSNISNLGNDRPDATGLPAGLPRDERSTERFFNTAAFALQPFGQFGNSGRNAVTGPGLMQWDFSVLKDTRIHEGHKLQFRFEAFNFPNHASWNTPVRNISFVDFGKIRSTRTAMREIQLGIKYIF
jgi:hypothetical protein